MKRKLALKVKEKTGITLITLIITIIILLILAGITISAITGDNGIIKNTGQAKEETEIANEKEIVEKATVQAMGNNKYGNIEESELQSELDKETGEGKTEATDIGDEFEVIFNESNRYYMVDKDGNVGEAQDIIKDKNPGDITTGKDGETLDGSEEHPYEIWCIEDLVTFSNMVNGEGIRMENGNPVEITKANNFSGKYVVLKTSLNFKSKLSYQNSERTDFGDINGVENDGNTLMNEMMTGTGFKPIGRDIYTKRFKGIFEGNGNQIYNLYENYTDRNIGLFGYIEGAVIQNLSIQGEIQLFSNGSAAGGIVGLGSGILLNCSSNINIEAKGVGVGGIVGKSWSKVEIINCSNFGKISNTSESTGGIFGRSEGDTNIYNSYNIGEIAATGYQVGGIVGYCVGNVNILNTYNSGRISQKGSNGRGGIVGAIGSNGVVNIDSVYSIGKVVEYSNVGGICEYRYDDSKSNLTINNSYYLSSVCNVAVANEEDIKYGVTKAESLTNEELKNYLNMYIQAENRESWKTWELGKEGYPIFK